MPGPEWLGILVASDWPQGIIDIERIPPAPFKRESTWVSCLFLTTPGTRPRLTIVFSVLWKLLCGMVSSCIVTVWCIYMCWLKNIIDFNLVLVSYLVWKCPECNASSRGLIIEVSCQLAAFANQLVWKHSPQRLPYTCTLPPRRLHVAGWLNTPVIIPNIL